MDKIFKYIDFVGEMSIKMWMAFLCKIKKYSDKLNTKIQTINNEQTDNDNYKSKYRKSGIVVLACVALIGFISFKDVFSKRTYKDVINTVLEVTFEGKTDDFLELFPEKYVNNLIYEYMDDNYISDKDEAKDKMIQELNMNSIKSTKKYNNEYGYGWTYTYEITDEVDYSNEQIETIYEDIIPFLESDITQAKAIDIEVTIKNNNKILDNQTITYKVYKSGGQWYLLL